MRTAFLHKFFSIVILVVAVMLFFSAIEGFFGVQRIGAQSAITELEGYVWSSTIGWISLNCLDEGVCGTSNYAVEVINNSGDESHPTLEGYGWSSNVGWVQFGNLTGCPAGDCDARVTGDPQTGQELAGWARALSYGDGWDGWISFNCDNDSTCGTSDYSVNVNVGSLSSYAWGSDVVGWIDASDVTFSGPCSPGLACAANLADGSEYTDQWCGVTTNACASGLICDTSDPTNCVDPTITFSFSVDPTTVRAGETVDVDWSANPVLSCEVTQDAEGGSQINSWTGAAGSETDVVIPGTSVFTLTCMDLASSTVELASTTVRFIPSFFES